MLENHIYDIGVTNQTQLFSNTTKETAEYAGWILKESQDIRLAIEKIKDITFQISAKHAITSALDKDSTNMIYKTEIDAYIKNKNVYRQNKSSMYVLVLGSVWTQWEKN